MRTHVKLVLVACVGAVTLGLGVSGSSANRLEFNAQTFRLVWSQLRVVVAEGIAEVRCPVTLEGSFHSRTLAKVSRALVGSITRVAIGQPANVCEGGAGTVLAATLPWHLQYQAFEGTLPRITGVKFRFIGVAWRISITELGISCLYRSEAGQPAAATFKLFRGLFGEWGPTITSVRADESLSLVPSGEFFCEDAEVRFEGSGTVTQLGSTNSLTLRLI